MSYITSISDTVVIISVTTTVVAVVAVVVVAVAMVTPASTSAPSSLITSVSLPSYSSSITTVSTTTVTATSGLPIIMIHYTMYYILDIRYALFTKKKKMTAGNHYHTCCILRSNDC